MTAYPHTAYFSMEIAVDQQLYTYSGGLGYLAGSHMRSAYDLGFPMTGVTILWNHGYGEQHINDDNTVTLKYSKRPTDFLTDTGVVVNVSIFGEDVKVKVLRLEPDTFGTVPILYLSTDVDGNSEHAKEWTSILYGGDDGARVAQEIILGVAGMRAIRALDIPIDTFHMNEGHALPLAFELLRENNQDIDAVRKQVVFTTHTPVAAGNEIHPAKLLNESGFFVETSYEQAVKLGGEDFSVTAAALKLSRIANGVSQLHGDVANNMWATVEGRCPIIAITNGVNQPYWQDLGFKVAQSPVDFRARKLALKQELLSQLVDPNKDFDPTRLTLVWARRFTGYKRADLMFRDMARMEALLKSKKIQILVAGKFHPKDTSGRDAMQKLIGLAKQYDNMAVLPNYELELSLKMKCVADVWLNNPRRPKEASGTSGMSAAMNGALHFSTHDGWAVEGTFHGINGYLINPGEHHYTTQDQQDEADYQSFINTLENDIIPTYYDDADTWGTMMQRSSESVCSYFTTHRMVMEYFNRMYIDHEPFKQKLQDDLLSIGGQQQDNHQPYPAESSVKEPAAV